MGAPVIVLRASERSQARLRNLPLCNCRHSTASDNCAHNLLESVNDASRRNHCSANSSGSAALLLASLAPQIGLAASCACSCVTDWRRRVDDLRLCAPVRRARARAQVGSGRHPQWPARNREARGAAGELQVSSAAATATTSTTAATTATTKGLQMRPINAAARCQIRCADG